MQQPIKREAVTTMPAIYQVASAAYLVAYMISAVVIILYALKYQSIFLAVILLPFMLHRMTTTLFAWLGSSVPTNRCYYYTVYTFFIVGGLQSLFLTAVTLLQAIEGYPQNLLLTLTAAIDFLWFYYVAMTPVVATTSSPQYVLVPMQIYPQTMRYDA